MTEVVFLTRSAQRVEAEVAHCWLYGPFVRIYESPCTLLFSHPTSFTSANFCAFLPRFVSFQLLIKKKKKKNKSVRERKWLA